MNNVAMAQAVQAAAMPKFRGHNTLKSKVVPRIPESPNREYTRIVNAYMGLLNKTLAEHLPIIRKAIDAEREGLRQDDIRDVLGVAEEEFLKIQREFEQKVEGFGLESKLESLTRRARDLSIREWKRMIRATLGINILDDYYTGEFFREMMKVWTQYNVSLIRRIPQDALGKMRGIIEEGYLSGKLNREIAKEIQEAYGMAKNHAQFIARDQVAKLNADITRAQQQDAGVEKYIWSSSGDVRVRDCHAELNGTVCSWSEPPVNWYMTKQGKRYTERYYPGEAPGCRCVALPVFNLPGLNLPWVPEEKK